MYNLKVASKNNALKPVLISLIFLILLGSLIYWLWQRQPRPEESEAQTPSKISKTTQEELEKPQLEINPKDGSVLAKNEVTFTGTAQSNDYIILASNNTLGVTQADENGHFEMDSQLVDGLSLINVAAIGADLVEKEAKSISLYVNSDTGANTVFAGSVKSIFDNIITISTTQGEQTIRQKTSTELILPKEEVDEEDSDIRVGDYLITLGSREGEKDFDAQVIEVIRDAKPQNIEKYIAGIMLSSVRANIFSTRSQKDANIVEFALNDETTILQNGEDATAEDLEKDIKAIIIYFSEEGENIPDLIYLLP